MSFELESIKLNHNFTELHIELGAAKLKINPGDKFSVTTDKNYISVEQNNNCLSIKEKKQCEENHLLKKHVPVILTIPKDFSFETVAIFGGSGDISINELNTTVSEFANGSGDISINNLVSSSNVKFANGSGDISIKVLNTSVSDFANGSGDISINNLVSSSNVKFANGSGVISINKLNTSVLKFANGSGDISINNLVSSSNVKIANGSGDISINKLNTSVAEFASGSGYISIEELNTDVLDFDLGTGKVTINNLVASSKAKIESGTGKLSIKNGLISNLDLDARISEITKLTQILKLPILKITSELKGICNLNFNVGKADITLLGSKEDYTIRIEKGTGNATIDNTPVRDSKTYGSGVNNIKIDNGMGNLAVNFKEK